LKKRFLAALLAVLMVANICACNYTPENDIGEETEEDTKEETSENNEQPTQTQNPETSENNEQSTQTQNSQASKSDVLSFEKYIGTWYDNFIPPHDFDVISNDEGEIECRLGIYRFTTFDLIITVEDGEISFVDKYNFISGKIVLKDNSIFVMVEESNIEQIQSGANWLFTIKEETNVT
jgi:hypothetical protein